MASTTINVLLSTFPGLSLPPTLSIPLDSDLPISAFTSLLSERLPSSGLASRLILSTNSNKQINPSSSAPLSSLLPSQDVTILPVRLSAPLCGGKGGFGSQLRAAGGRMSSRKNRNGTQDVNGSNRNLDGRRLRTITEAKNLAEYLALKPEMDKKEKEERRQRWESIVEAAGRKEEEIKRGKNTVRLDGEWVEAKEEAENKTRDAVAKAMRAGMLERDQGRTGSESSATAEGNGESADEMEASASGSDSVSEQETKQVKASGTRTFFAWDDDEDMSDDDDEAEGAEEETLEVPTTYKGKGKARA